MKKWGTWTILVLVLVYFFSCKEDTSIKLKTISTDKMVTIPSGTLHMGGDNEQASPNEFPKHDVPITAFLMDETEVTNAQFKLFVDATGYKTIAERPIIWEEIKKQLPPDAPEPAPEILQPGALVFKPTDTPVPLNDPALWWEWTIGANWMHPQGPESNIDKIMNHPVVHVAWEDAAAYANWSGKRLPTEAEWEWASRGDNAGYIYPWGNELMPNGVAQANFWQGFFPFENDAKDMHVGSAPVKSYPPNGYGLYDMAGNVWEWCQDWYDDKYYASPDATEKQNQGPKVAYNSMIPYQQERVIRGGSFLCSEAYCSGYRNARRMGSTPDTGLSHTGFRCVKNIK